MQVEQEIKDAIGLQSPQVEIEVHPAKDEPQRKEATASIYDFSKYLSDNEPPQRKARS